jgi:predicted Zn-dependent peptidase
MNITFSKLSNKTPVILAQMPSTQVFTALVLFKVGSRYETAKGNGISHFLEHLFFKGTINRPTALDISKELDGVGADYNAFTGKDYTGYYVKVTKRHARLAVDLLQDLLVNPLFEPAEIDRERGVIIEEINMYDDNPMATAEELAEELLFGKNHPLGYRIAGPRENIRKITRNEIIKYREHYYRPDNMVIVLAGKIPAGAMNWLEEGFATIAKGKKVDLQPKQFTLTQKSFRLHIEKKKTAQSHLAITFPAPTYTDRDLFTAKVLSVLLGGGMSSRLFINVRERQGLCYYIRAGMTPYADQGAFMIQAGFDTKRIKQAIAAIMEQLRIVRDVLVEEEELTKAKECIRGHLALRLEDADHIASWWGQQFLFQQVQMTPAQYEERIVAVTARDIQRLAQKLFQHHLMNAVIVGPYTPALQKQLQPQFQL